MKTIKIIDLINKIDNGDEVPEKIKYQKNIFIYDRERKDYIHKIDEYGLQNETILFNIMDSHFIRELLENEVEIIEEDKEIEPLNAYKLMESPYMADLLRQQRYDEFMEHIKQSEVEIVNTIAELVNEVNKLNENKK